MSDENVIVYTELRRNSELPVQIKQLNLGTKENTVLQERLKLPTHLIYTNSGLLVLGDDFAERLSNGSSDTLFERTNIGPLGASFEWVPKRGLYMGEQEGTVRQLTDADGNKVRKRGRPLHAPKNLDKLYSTSIGLLGSSRNRLVHILGANGSSRVKRAKKGFHWNEVVRITHVTDLQDEGIFMSGYDFWDKRDIGTMYQLFGPRGNNQWILARDDEPILKMVSDKRGSYMLTPLHVERFMDSKGNIPHDGYGCRTHKRDSLASTNENDKFVDVISTPVGLFARTQKRLIKCGNGKRPSECIVYCPDGIGPIAYSSEKN